MDEENLSVVPSSWENFKIQKTIVFCSRKPITFKGEGRVDP